MTSCSNTIIYTVQKEYSVKRIKHYVLRNQLPRNQLPGDIKSETSYTKFKEYIDTWFVPKCRSNECMNI